MANYLPPVNLVPGSGWAGLRMGDVAQTRQPAHLSVNPGPSVQVQHAPAAWLIASYTPPIKSVTCTDQGTHRSRNPWRSRLAELTIGAGYRIDWRLDKGVFDSTS